jgi:transposase
VAARFLLVKQVVSDFITELEELNRTRRNRLPTLLNLPPLVEALLSHHPNVTLHFIPTYSSWLNQVEIWFSKLER